MGLVKDTYGTYDLIYWDTYGTYEGTYEAPPSGYMYMYGSRRLCRVPAEHQP